MDEQRVEQQPELSEAAKRWQEENREKIDAWNAWVEIHGLPLGEPDWLQGTDAARVRRSATDDQRLEKQPELSEAAKQWQRDNQDAIDSMNSYVREHGLPLDEFRQI